MATSSAANSARVELLYLSEAVPPPHVEQDGPVNIPLQGHDDDEVVVVVVVVEEDILLFTTEHRIP